ncbi:4Fe-4S binding protein [Eubacteriales bacterium OttesenSCG-928-A19]|nr:4Fe-4S binding protein [Eubacteriales bacterium OttesenSCG-928-A19]
MARRLRLLIQAGWTLITNSYAVGFVQGKIYKGALKNVCLPGLNCYSCPGAVGSCPLGSLQAVMGSWKFNVSLYMAGFFMIVGALCGRLVCGFLCPFGLVQDLLHRIPIGKKRNRFRADRVLQYLKYVIGLVFVVLLPLLVVDIIGQGNPTFCKYICPSGMLLGGWPLVAKNPSLQAMLGWLFAWKNVILLVTVVASVLIYRPFCKYICPLGAIYGFFNRTSLYRLRVDSTKCNGCGACSRACKMCVEPWKTPNHRECIRCGGCIKACPQGAISAGIGEKGLRRGCKREETAV